MCDFIRLNIVQHLAKKDIIMNTFKAVFALFSCLMIGQTAQANQYQEAMAFFNSSATVDLQTLLSEQPVVNSNGRCVAIYSTRSVENRAYVALPKEGEFGRTVFVGFEYFNDQSTDQTIIQDAEKTYQRYWGTLYQDRFNVLQAAYNNQSANHYNEYRTKVNTEGERFLIRKYYADDGVFGPNRRMYIAPFDPIEFCWVKLD